jgi:hypothetical protein
MAKIVFKCATLWLAAPSSSTSYDKGLLADDTAVAVGDFVDFTAFSSYVNAADSDNATPVDLSPYISAVNINYAADMVETTSMSSSCGDAAHTMIGGLKTWSIDATLHQDFSTVDNFLFSRVGEYVAFAIKPQAATVTTSNPVYYGDAVIETYNPVSASVGALGETSFTMQPFDVAVSGSFRGALKRLSA